jgi:hypothetical protein
MYKNILFIGLIVVILFLLYKLYHYYQKQKFINEILEEWKKITNDGVVEQDEYTNFKGDYYLSNNSDDYYSHIHLIIVDNILKDKDKACDVINKAILMGSQIATELKDSFCQ